MSWDGILRRILGHSLAFSARGREVALVFIGLFVLVVYLPERLSVSLSTGSFFSSGNLADEVTRNDWRATWKGCDL